MTNEDIAVRLENHEQEIKSLKHRMNEREKTDGQSGADGGETQGGEKAAGVLQGRVDE